jgi:hypothetical protein
MMCQCQSATAWRRTDDVIAAEYNLVAFLNRN